MHSLDYDFLFCFPSTDPLPDLLLFVSFFRSAVGWLRDLTSEGVEPNPGPCVNQGAASSPTQCDCIYTLDDLRKANILIVTGVCPGCRHPARDHRDNASSSSPALVSSPEYIVCDHDREEFSSSSSILRNGDVHSFVPQALPKSQNDVSSRLLPTPLEPYSDDGDVLMVGDDDFEMQLGLEENHGSMSTIPDSSLSGTTLINRREAPSKSQKPAKKSEEDQVFNGRCNCHECNDRYWTLAVSKRLTRSNNSATVTVCPITMPNVQEVKGSLTSATWTSSKGGLPCRLINNETNISKAGIRLDRQEMYQWYTDEGATIDCSIKVAGKEHHVKFVNRHLVSTDLILNDVTWMGPNHNRFRNGPVPTHLQFRIPSLLPSPSQCRVVYDLTRQQAAGAPLEWTAEAQIAVHVNGISDVFQVAVPEHVPSDPTVAFSSSHPAAKILEVSIAATFGIEIPLRIETRNMNYAPWQTVAISYVTLILSTAHTNASLLYSNSTSTGGSGSGGGGSDMNRNNGRYNSNAASSQSANGSGNNINVTFTMNYSQLFSFIPPRMHVVLEQLLLAYLSGRFSTEYIMLDPAAVYSKSSTTPHSQVLPINQSAPTTSKSTVKFLIKMFLDIKKAVLLTRQLSGARSDGGEKGAPFVWQEFLDVLHQQVLIGVGISGKMNEMLEKQYKLLIQIENSTEESVKSLDKLLAYLKKQSVEALHAQLHRERAKMIALRSKFHSLIGKLAANAVDSAFTSEVSELENLFTLYHKEFLSVFETMTNITDQIKDELESKRKWLMYTSGFAVAAGGAAAWFTVGASMAVAGGVVATSVAITTAWLLYNRKLLLLPQLIQEAEFLLSQLSLDRKDLSKTMDALQKLFRSQDLSISEAELNAQLHAYQDEHVKQFSAQHESWSPRVKQISGSAITVI